MAKKMDKFCQWISLQRNRVLSQILAAASSLERLGARLQHLGTRTVLLICTHLHWRLGEGARFLSAHALEAGELADIPRPHRA